MNKKMLVLVLVLLAFLLLIVAAVVVFLVIRSMPSALPRIETLPYTDPEQVWISRAYSSEHQGVDISTDQVIDLIAPSDGTFLKEMYFHAGVPRWQVNAEVRMGGYAVELLLEPGNSVTEAEAQEQYNMLISNGARVKAGDLLGQRFIAPGQPYSILHLAVRENSTGTFFCPLGYISEQAGADLLELFYRDYPGGTLCSEE
jgi:hypothetical protein